MKDTSVNSDDCKRAVFLFEMHEPVVLETFQTKDIGTGKDVINELNGAENIRSFSDYCVTFNTKLLELIKERPSVRLCISVSGPTLSQIEMYAPEVLQSFRELSDTGAVEFLGETSHHSLACMMSVDEFREQIVEYRELMAKHFGKEPVVFKNTDLIYQDDLGKLLAELGFSGVLTNGDTDTEEQCFVHPEESSLTLLVRHESLSRAVDQVMEFQFSPDEVVTSISRIVGSSSIVCISYKKAASLRDEFGTHPMVRLLERMSEDDQVVLSTMSELIDAKPDKPERSTKVWTSRFGGVTPWLGNEMQQKAFDVLSLLREPVANLGDPSIRSLWKYLQISDHFFYMGTEPLEGVSGATNPYQSAYEAFANYMNILNDFAIRLNWVHPSSDFDQSVRAAESERHHIQAPLWAIKSESKHKHVSESRI